MDTKVLPGRPQRGSRGGFGRILGDFGVPLGTLGDTFSEDFHTFLESVFEEGSGRHFYMIFGHFLTIFLCFLEASAGTDVKVKTSILTAICYT